MKEINIFTHEFFPKKGGIGTFAAEMANAAANIGFSVCVYAPKGSTKPFASHLYDLVCGNNVGTHRKRCVRSTSLYFARNFLTLRNSINYIVEPGPMLALYRLDRYFSITIPNIVLTFHGSEIMRWSMSQEGVETLNRLVELSSQVTCVSGYVSNLLLEKAPGAKDKLLLTPNAPKKTYLDFLADNNLKAKQGDKVQLLTVARLHPRKGIDYLLSCFRDLPETVKKKISYKIIGTGDDEGYIRKLKKLALETGIEVCFKGQQSEDEVIKAYRMTDLFVLTSVPYEESIEGFGLVYLEAAAFQVPSIAHDIGGVSDAIRHQETGILVKPFKKNNLLQEVERLVNDEQARTQLGMAAYSGLGRYSWENNIRVVCGLDGAIVN